ncbi:hypothetical protein Tco_0515461 [Tanacetum coccineum]
MVLDLCLEQEQTLGFISMRYSCNPGIGSNNLLWKVITRLQVISGNHLDVVAMKHMASNFAKLDKFEGVDFRRWQKKMHFLLSSMSVVYVLTTPIPEDGGDDATVEQIRKRAKWDNGDYVCRGLILKDFKHTLKHKKEELTLVELGSHLRIKESFKTQDSDKPKGNIVVGPQ